MGPDQQVLPHLGAELLHLRDLGAQAHVSPVLALQPRAEGSQEGCEARLRSDNTSASKGNLAQVCHGLACSRKILTIMVCS